MNKKTLTILIVVAVVLVAGIAFAVTKLYSSAGSSSAKIDGTRLLEKDQLIAAVPSDAAIVFCFKNFGHACEILGDTLSVFGELASGKFNKITSRQYGALKRSPAIMSVHYSKDMPPLLILEAEKAIADTTQDLRDLLDAADSSGLQARINGNMLMIF